MPPEQRGAPQVLPTGCGVILDFGPMVLMRCFLVTCVSVRSVCGQGGCPTVCRRVQKWVPASVLRFDIFDLPSLQGGSSAAGSA